MVRRVHSVQRLVVAACAAVCALAASGLGSGVDAVALGASACGSATAAAIAAVDATVTHRIYRNELSGSEVRADLGHVTGAGDLVGALARGDLAGVRAATARIVFHPHWHIVRLRVLDPSGRVLADVGGPYVIAPVSGRLRSGSKTVGSFVMSVQDDAGVVRLESRFVGDPIAIYMSGRLAVERGAAFPTAPPTGSVARIGHDVYPLIRQIDHAFPTGTLTLVMLVPGPAAAVAARPCTEVRGAEFGRVAMRFARLAVALPSHYTGYAATVTQFTGALVFVRAGARTVASSGGPGPAQLPTGGAVTYRGRQWLVYSFVPRAGTRVYVLASAA